MFKRICSLCMMILLTFVHVSAQAQQLLQMENKAYCRLVQAENKTHYLLISSDREEGEYFVLYPYNNKWYWKPFASMSDVAGSERVGEIAFRYIDLKSLNDCVEILSLFNGVNFFKDKTKDQTIKSKQDIRPLPF